MKHYKNIITVVFTILISSASYSQLKVLNDGSVRINSYTGNWGSAIKTTVHYPNSCAYHLRYGGQDKFYVNAHGWLWCEQGGWFGSDLKLKKNITSINNPLNIINQLNGIKFMFKNDSIDQNDSDYSRERLGFIAQEVEKVLPGLVRTIPQNDTKAVAYTDLIPLLVEGIKAQQKQIDYLEKLIKGCCKGDGSEKSINNSEIESGSENEELIDNSILFQNNPNPFNERTAINYTLSGKVNNASILIFDMQGTLIKSYNNLSVNKQKIVINSSELIPGMYMYSLLINGKEIDTKKMILTK